MSRDRAVITEGTIMMLIDWYLDKELGDKYNNVKFDSHLREGYSVELTLIKKEK